MSDSYEFVLEVTSWLSELVSRFASDGLAGVLPREGEGR